MKKSIKNIICIFLILLMCVMLVVTMNYAKTHVTTSLGKKMEQNMGDGNTPPDMPNNNTENSNMGEPPAKPDSNSNENSKNSTNMENPPEKPNGQNENIKPEDGSSSNKTMQEKPADMNDNSSGKLSYSYYIVFAIECLVMSLSLMYLLMSIFNKKTFKETLCNSDKVVIYALSVVVLTAALTYLSGMLTNKFFLTTSDKMDESTKMQSQNISYSASKEITEDADINEGTFESTKEDQNAILVNGKANVTISNIKVNKTGDSDGGDNTSFYGTNSSILAKSGANLTLKNITVNTDATGANGVFCYGGSATTNNSSSDGTTVNISDSKITTTKDNSGGIMTTGGGTMKASNLEINTAGTSSAAIRTDRGGGNVEVDGGTYTTTGKGSPSIYSTASINVRNATLCAKASEGIVIEGKNSVIIDNCNLVDTNNELNGKSTTYKNIFLYQSMSGDADNGTAKFTAKNSNITTNKGDTFYITNTTASIDLENNSIINNDSTGYFLRAKSDSWGNTGSNGGNVTLTLTNQKAIGNISVDSVSTLNMNIKENSYYEGTINSDNGAKSIKITLDSSSKLKLTEDSYITSLENADASNSNIDFNGYKLYVNGKAIN